jgi:uncharacterized protein (DUF1778 family)
MKLGRPKLTDKEKKGKMTGVRLRQDERELIEKAAASKKQTFSGWIRATLITSATRQIKA